MTRKALWLLIAVGCVAGTSHAGEPAPARPTRRLSLEEAIALALAHNLRLAAEKINPRRAQAVVVEREAIFDPVAYGELTREKLKEQQTDSIVSRRRQRAAGMMGVAKLLPPGTLVDVRAEASREWRSDTPVTILGPAYSEEWGISIAQPLLRGFGVRVNTAGIATAVNERRMAQAQLRTVALTTVADVCKGYWQLVFARRDRELLERSLERAVEFREVVEARVKARTIGARDPAVAQAKAEAATRREALVAAEQTIREAEDRLKVLTDLAADRSLWHAAIVPTAEPSDTAPRLEPDRAAETALAERPDYRQARLAIDNQEILLHVRRNELKPRLDLAVGYGNSGLGGSWHRAEHELGSLDYFEWVVGLTFEVPIGNRAARSRFRQTRLDRDQARLHLEALERQIQLEVRNAVRAVRVAAERLRAATLSIEAERERLRAEEIRFRDARIGTIQDVLDAQDNLADAERRALQALIDLNQAVVEAERRQGTLLEAHHVRWEED
ncbi:MAG: TolC family protein [Planctomycetota bacterium]